MIPPLSYEDARKFASPNVTDEQVRAIVEQSAHAAAYFERLIARREKAIKAREEEVATWEGLKGTEPASFKLGETPFAKVMYLKAADWNPVPLFGTQPVVGGIYGVDSSEMTRRCVASSPDNRFHYCNATLPVGHSIGVCPHQGAEGRVFFDADVTFPVLAELKPDFDYLVWMSTTPHEVMTQWPGVQMAKGRVVVGGLGLGWFLNAVCEKPEVTEVIVVEREYHLTRWLQPVLVEKYPAVAEKVRYWINDDVYNVADRASVGLDSRARGRDVMYLLDIWPRFGQADRDEKFLALEAALGKDRVWGWGRGATQEANRGEKD